MWREEAITASSLLFRKKILMYSGTIVLYLGGRKMAEIKNEERNEVVETQINEVEPKKEGFIKRFAAKHPVATRRIKKVGLVAASAGAGLLGGYALGKKNNPDVIYVENDSSEEEVYEDYLNEE